MKFFGLMGVKGRFLIKTLSLMGAVLLLGTMPSCTCGNPLPPGSEDDGGDIEGGGGDSNNNTATCLDHDGDLYGVGDGCMGLDCNDYDPQMTVICAEPDCTNPTNPSCPCTTEGETLECYTGNLALQGTGACQAGLQACRVGYWSPCEKEVLPTAESCDGVDNDCDGRTDEDILGCNITLPDCSIPNTPGCTCTTGSNMPCFSGNPVLRDVGQCHDGTQNCVNGLWGACMNEGLPSPELCDHLDNDCDGVIDEGFPDDCRFEAPCLDEDGDGYGSGAGCEGPDCDDTNPACTADCDGSGCGGPVNCQVPTTPGCPCTATEPLACYDGDAALQGVGVCKGGIQTCRMGFWSPCEGSVVPSTEVCDGLDNDCDTEIDEGLPPDCGCRDGSCNVAEVGDHGEPFAPTTSNSEGVMEDIHGQLVLGKIEVDKTFVWVANSEEGTVSKLDSNTGAEVGRYVSALNVPGIPPWSTPCSQGGNCPSRTAVDLEGNVWTANRAHMVNGIQPSVTKIAHNKELDCLDRNGDGQVLTSQDVNGDGRIDLSNPAEFPGVDDECVLFTQPVGSPGGIARAVGICVASRISGGSPWVGLYNDQMVVELDNATGAILQQVPVPLHPYGAICDKDDYLWVTSSGWADNHKGCEGLVRVDTHTGDVGPLIDTPAPPSCGGKHGCYGISLDSQQRIWLGGYPCEAAFRYNPFDGTWLTLETPGRGVTRGIAVRLADPDGPDDPPPVIPEETVWVAHSWLPNGTPVANLTAFTTEGEPFTNVNIPDGQGSIGSGIDFANRIWAINESTNNATRYDPATGQTQSFPVGGGPYTYSDFTGYNLRNFTNPSGWYTYTYTGCPPEDSPTHWLTFDWEGFVPLNTQVYAEFRSADTEAGLASTEWSEPLYDAPVDLSFLPPGNFIEVRITLVSEDRFTTPLIRKLQLTFECTDREPEVCDCEDNDLDGQIDEDPGICPNGGACLCCQCYEPCLAMECFGGLICKNDFCVPPSCEP